jgi:hypothetical protein
MANKYFNLGKKIASGIGQAINKVKTNVPKTEKQKKLRDLKINNQKLKSSKAKLDQSIFEFKRNEKYTFPSKKRKTESNTERYKRIQGENTKAIKNIVNKAFEKKATGGRVGRRFGSPNPKKTNVQKIKETFAPKKKLSPKQMKIAKQAGNPNRIDAPDFKKLRGKA